MPIVLLSSSFSRSINEGRLHLWDIAGETRALGLAGMELDDAHLRLVGRGLLGNLRRYLSLTSPTPPERTYDHSLLRRLQKALQYFHVPLVAWDCDSALGSPDLLPGARAYIRLALRTAHQFGASILCLTIDETSVSENLSPIVATLSVLAVDAEQAGVRLALENHTPAVDVDHILGIIQGVNSPWLGTCANFGNLRPGRAEDDFERLAVRAFHAHAKSWAFDARGEETAIPYEHRLGVLRSLGYTGSIAVEYAGEGDPVEGIRQTVNLIRRYWAA